MRTEIPAAGPKPIYHNIWQELPAQGTLNLCCEFYYVVSLGDYFIPLIPWKEKNPFYSFHFASIDKIRSCPLAVILSLFYKKSPKGQIRA